MSCSVISFHSLINVNSRAIFYPPLELTLFFQGAPQVGSGGGGVAIDSSMHQKVDSLINEIRAVRATQVNCLL